GDGPLAGAFLAAAALDIEAECRRGVAALLRLDRFGKERANGVIETDVRRRVGPRRPPDGRLIDVDHVADVLAAGELVVVAGQDAAVVEEGIEPLVNDLVDQRALARPRRAGDAHELLERDRNADVLQVILTGAADDDRLAVRRPALCG